MSITAATSVIDFPKAKKRGAKVKRGPCADIRAFPVPLNGDELRKTWYWLYEKHDKWDNEELYGEIEHRGQMGWREWVEIAGALAAENGKPLTEARMREEIEKWRQEVRKRTQIKDWLEAMEIDWNKVRNPQQALSFVFDMLHSRALPTSA